MVRLAVASLAGVLVSWYIGRDYARWHSLGREAFLSFQSRRFDEHFAAPSPGTALACWILVVAAIGAYEGVVALVTKLVSRSPDA